MSSHTTDGCRVLVYHEPKTDEPLAHQGASIYDLLRYRDQLQAQDHSGGRWAVHELGPEVPRELA